MKREITLRQVLIPAFLTVVVLPMLLMALFSILRLKANMQETLEMQIESNLEKADQVLDMVLDKYKTILYDFCTDDSIVEIVESVNEGVDDKDVNTGKLRRELSHICNRNDGVVGITLRTAGDEKVIYYDRLASSSSNAQWASKVRVPDINAAEDYYAVTVPLKRNEDNIYLIQIARNLVDYRNIHKKLGTVVMSINEEILEKALDPGEGKSIYLCRGNMIISAPDNEDIGKNINDIPTKNMLVTSRRNETSGWNIYNFHALDVYSKTVREQALFWVFIGVGIMAALLGIVYFATRPVLKSLDNVVDAMETVEKGDFGAWLTINQGITSEMKKIYSGFNEMVEQIDALVGQVKQAVVEQKNAEISALEAQIDPHFLYNTLDTINWKAIEKEEYEISGMVGALADILRYTVRNAGGETTIEKELYWLDEYMLLQSAKLGRKLNTIIDVPDGLLECRIHKLLLQPFVENSIKHGLYNIEGECILKISIKKLEEQLHIIIEDNGRGMSKNKVEELNKETGDEGEHLGVANVRKRLKLYYGDRADMFFESRAGRYTRVHLFIPLEEMGGNLSENSDCRG